MSLIDWIIVAVYVLVVIGIGVHFSRRSATSIRSYFLSDNENRWWMLAASGSTSYYDLAGTIFLVSVFFVVGLKAMFMLFAWGGFSTAVVACFSAVWIRRTRVMTAVELIHLRFGEDTGGRLARTAAALLMVTFLVFSVGYVFVGLSKFLPVIVPIDFGSSEFGGQVMAITLIMLTTLYVTVGGFSGVIATDVIQAVLSTIGGFAVGIFAFMTLGPESISQIHQSFDISLFAEGGKLSNLPSGYESWENFDLLLPFWLAAGLLFSFTGAGGHYQEQRFLAARTTSDAAKIGFAWGLFSLPRWFLIAGCCFLAIAGVLGTNEPEEILPLVIAKSMPTGMRGVLVASLLAAFMSTFSSILNAAASMIVRDLVQPAAPDISEHNMVRISYAATVGTVLMGLLVGLNAESLRSVWSFMLIGLIGGSILPNLMRWFWWRTNGWGYSIGILAGLLSAIAVFIAQKWLQLEFADYQYAPVIWLITATACVVGSLSTRKTPESVTDEFYKRVRPFGFWQPVRARLGVMASSEQGLLSRPRIALNIVLHVAFLIGITVLPFFVVGHYTVQATVLAVGLIGLSVALYYSWYVPVTQLED